MMMEDTMFNRALLFVNGEPPSKALLRQHINLADYDCIACTDGAYEYLVQQHQIIPDFVIGDLDSIQTDIIPLPTKLIHTPDQNKTDFEKALLFLRQYGVTQFTVLGATGGASDHFLENISIACQYANQCDIRFYDEICYFFFVHSGQIIKNVKGKTISLMPFGQAQDVTLSGFVYPLTKVDLMLGGMTSVRNEAAEDHVSVTFSSGNLLAFVSFY